MRIHTLACENTVGESPRVSMASWWITAMMTAVAIVPPIRCNRLSCAEASAMAVLLMDSKARVMAGTIVRLIPAPRKANQTARSM